MKLLYEPRESAHLVRTVRLGWLRGLVWLVWPACALLTLLALLYILQWLDDRDTSLHLQAARERAAELARVYQQGRAYGNAEMIATAEAGWAAARTEADRKCGGTR